jgi:hypothetical protein
MSDPGVVAAGAVDSAVTPDRASARSSSPPQAVAAATSAIDDNGTAHANGTER